jgi:hypothetical protein
MPPRSWTFFDSPVHRCFIVAVEWLPLNWWAQFAQKECEDPGPSTDDTVLGRASTTQAAKRREVQSRSPLTPAIPGGSWESRVVSGGLREQQNWGVTTDLSSTGPQKEQSQSCGVLHCPETQGQWRSRMGQMQVLDQVPPQLTLGSTPVHETSWELSV